MKKTTTKNDKVENITIGKTERFNAIINKLKIIIKEKELLSIEINKLKSKNEILKKENINLKNRSNSIK
jgi:FtsZ-binding cell division protein ZapB